ncbi:MAG: PIN domain-containing protein [Acidobacteria bacterium]|nr:PIN domain-containing protein [Acidobacteriota bacterium]
MNLTVDASIVVKWFVEEPLRDEARRLLSHRLGLHAPEILLAEFANTIWKKARTGEIDDPQPYFDELARLRDNVTLHPYGQLVEHAAQIATAIDHPVYDCLYLACAEATASALVTADKRFARKIAEHMPGADVRYIGAPGVAETITAAATALVISREKVEMLSDAYDVSAATDEHVIASLRGQSTMPPALTPEDLDLMADSPSSRRLVDMIGALSDEERVDLLALGWFGAGLQNSDWRKNFEHASGLVGRVSHHYVAGYGEYWRRGYALVSGLKQT